MAEVRATRAYVAGFGTAGSLLAGAAVLFVLASAVVAFNGWPQLTTQASPAAVVVAPARPASGSPTGGRLTAVANARALGVVGAALTPGAAARGGSPVSGSGAGRLLTVTAGGLAAQPGASAAISPTGSAPSPQPCGTCGPSTPPGGSLGSTVQNATATVGSTVAATGANLGSTVGSVAGTLASKLTGISPPLAATVQRTGASVGSTASGVTGAAGGVVAGVGQTLGGLLGAKH